MASDGKLKEIGGQVSHNGDLPSQTTQEPDHAWFPWRKNVLALLLMAYLSIFLIFVVLLFYGMNPQDAYDKVSVPFVALVGGTLTITKDLLR